MLSALFPFLRSSCARLLFPRQLSSDFFSCLIHEKLIFVFVSDASTAVESLERKFNEISVVLTPQLTFRIVKPPDEQCRRRDEGGGGKGMAAAGPKLSALKQVEQKALITFWVLQFASRLRELDNGEGKTFQAPEERRLRSGYMCAMTKTNSR